jgi:hypothetical protein
MGSIGSSSAFGSTVDLYMINRKIFQIFSICVGLKVVNKSKNNPDRFLWPSSECFAKFTGLSSSTDTSVVFGVRNTTSMSKDILEILFSLGYGKTLNCFSSLICIFIMHSKIFSGCSSDYVMKYLPLEVEGFLE